MGFHGSTQSNFAAIEAQIEQWLRGTPESGNQDLIAEMIRTVLRLAADEPSRGDLKILNRTLKELRQAFKIFAPYENVRKVSIFGSTRVPERDPYYDMTMAVAGRLAEENFMIITGAGPGIMQAGHEGAGREKSFGVNIRLPAIQKANSFIDGDPKLMSFHFFFTRKLMFVKEADAVVIFPGGFGTHDELTESITLAQTGKSQLVPLILIDVPGGTYWQEWLAFLRSAVKSRGYITDEEMGFFKVFDDVEAAVAEIKNFYRNYHSYRFVKRELVIRLNSAPSPALIERINRDFRDIFKAGVARQTAPLPDEADEPATLHLHRLLVPFNQMDFARLRQMIDAINQAG
ncbi:MAG: cytochrome D ubiquinol oxidase subunit II [Deltaproteobacteria bacterium]|nr:cytochrome D ubiquinol oxidase subunit II [Deltaproteobacteria bacterium]